MAEQIWESHCWRKLNIKAWQELSKRHVRLHDQVEESSLVRRNQMQLFGHLTRLYVWQTQNTANHYTPCIPTVKSCWWGGFLAAGPWRLLKVQGKMKTIKYSSTEMVGRHGGCSAVAKSKPRPQSNREFVPGLEKRVFTTNPHTTWHSLKRLARRNRVKLQNPDVEAWLRSIHTDCDCSRKCFH